MTDEGLSIADSGKPKWLALKQASGSRSAFASYPDREARLNAWIDAHPEPKPSGPEAIRRLMERGLYAAERRKLRAPKPRKAGHDEERVGLALGPFRLGDHAPRSAPALPGRPAQVLEAPRRLARPSGLLLGLDQLDRDLLDEAIVAGEPEHVVDPVLLAPGHQGLAGEAR